MVEKTVVTVNEHLTEFISKINEIEKIKYIILFGLF